MIPGDLKPNIMYEFYRKEISNKTPMHARSAAPLKQKITTMANEFLRRMTNTSKHLPKAALEAKLTEYANDLKSGEFSTNIVSEALNSAVKNYNRLLKYELEGIRPVNRPAKLGQTEVCKESHSQRQLVQTKKEK